MAVERLRLTGLEGLYRVYSQGSGISQSGEYSTLWFWGVVGSAVVIGFLRVPVVWGSKTDRRRG